MSWKTIYVVGNEGFCDDVVKALNRSDVEFMTGFNSRSEQDSHELFWVRENLDIRDFKLAIGAKLVLKYRLKFFVSLEGFIETISSTEFTEDEKKKVQQMRMMNSAA